MSKSNFKKKKQIIKKYVTFKKSQSSKSLNLHYESLNDNSSNSLDYIPLISDFDKIFNDSLEWHKKSKIDYSLLSNFQISD